MKLYQVDAFTHTPFTGNPAGVCLLDSFPEPKIMQAIAAEMNISETAFVARAGGKFAIRYFTPNCEVPLCGHATLASAHIIYQLGIIPREQSITFSAKECDLGISCEGAWIKMTFPAYPLHLMETPQNFSAIIGAEPLECYHSENNWIIARLAKEQDVLNAKPDFEAIRQANLALITAVTAPADTPGYDFVVRVFCNPDTGITEDPVTGAANCILVPYWHQSLHKTTFKSRQLSARGGELKTRLVDNSVEILGQAVTIFCLEMLLPS